MFDDLMEAILAIIPNATFHEDAHGQIVIATNLTSVSSEGHLIDMGDE